MLNNILLSSLSTIIFIINIIFNYGYFRQIIKILLQNIFNSDGRGIEYERFYLDNEEYSIYSNKKNYFKFYGIVVLSISLFIVILFLEFAMFINIDNEKFGLYFSLFTLICPILCSCTIAEKYQNRKENFKKNSVSIEKLKSFSNYEECKEFIKNKQLKLSVQDAIELNSHYKKIYNINEDCFLSYMEEIELKKEN